MSEIESSDSKKGEIRQFASGATRDTDKNKLDFEGFLSPTVLLAYAEYLHKHRVQRDGNLRDSDNWQKLFGDKHFDVCMKSGLRHVFNVWMYHRGYELTETIDDALGGAIFNLMAY